MLSGAQTIDTVITDTVRIEHYDDGSKDTLSISKIDSITFGYMNDTIWVSNNLGSFLLPGNATCDTQYISVTGCGGLTTLSYNGYTYDLVEIGGQCWFKDNLQTTTYKDGTPIDYPGTDNTAWQSNTTGAYAWYANDSSTNASTYAALYNWYAVDNSAGLCPTGWHVPTDCEWMYLEDTLGMSTVDQESTVLRGTDEGGMLKDTTLWNSPNTGATNISGFTGLPGGYSDYSGSYSYVGYFGYWWSSTQLSTYSAWARSLNCSYSGVGRTSFTKDYGYSVRCLKD
jgi:uncharacterized protein (TIGR02145 family)